MAIYMEYIYNILKFCVQNYILHPILLGSSASSVTPHLFLQSPTVRTQYTFHMLSYITQITNTTFNSKSNSKIQDFLQIFSS